MRRCGRSSAGGKTAAVALLLALFGALLLGEPSLAAKAAAGKAIYDAQCSICHGPGGQGDGPASDQFGTYPADFQVGVFKFDADSDGTTGSDADLRLVIREGASSFGGSPLMAPWPSLSDPQIEDVIGFVRSLKR